MAAGATTPTPAPEAGASTATAPNIPQQRQAFCTNCGTHAEDADQKFCGNCGEDL
jgi:membrane protease subunit (stomatin/prohibitin family)